MAIRPNGRGNVTESHVSWTHRKSVPNMSSPLLADGRLYMVTDSGGIVTSMDARTGEQIWRNRLRPSGDHWASPLLANGKIYFSSKTGDVTVIEAGKEYRGVASNRLDASFIASPAVAGNSLVLRSTTHLYCLEKGYERSAEEGAAERREAEARMLAGKGDGKKNDGKGSVVQSPRVKALLEDGTITREQSQRLDAFALRLREMVKAGKLTRKEAIDLWQALLDDQGG